MCSHGCQGIKGTRVDRLCLALERGRSDGMGDLSWKAVFDKTVDSSDTTGVLACKVIGSDATMDETGGKGNEMVIL